MNQETIYWKLAWDTFHLQVFDYEGDVGRINDWIEKENFDIRSILEIGCGAGRYLISLEKLGYKCVGVDKDIDILEYAKQFVLKNETDIKLMQGDVLRKIHSILKSKFDLVLAKHLSFSLSDLGKVLDYAKKALTLDGPRLLVFDFLVASGDSLDKNILSIDSAVKDNFFLVRLNQMKLREKFNKYCWEEVYIIREAQSGFTVTKTNQRSLWFISRDDLEKLLTDKGIKVENELEEITGVNNLKGVTIYGRFS